MDVRGEMGEIVREMATAEAITDSDQEVEEAVAQTETETSAAISKLQFHRCVKKEGTKKREVFIKILSLSGVWGSFLLAHQSQLGCRDL